MQQKRPTPQRNVLYGIHPVLEALTSGKSIDKIFVRHGTQHERIKEIRTQAKELSIPVQQVPDEKLLRLVRDGNHQGVVAMLAAIEFQPLEETLLSIQEKGKAPLLLLLDGVSDVRNFGAIARTAECMGVDAIIIPTSRSASINADALKTSAGALLHIPVCRVANLVDSILLMQAYQIQTIGCTEKAAQSLYEHDFKGPICMVLGSEDKGISSPLLKRVDQLLKIPLLGNVSSLNVSVAAGMALSEVARQRISSPE